MSDELTPLTDFQGRHNIDLDRSATRVLEGGTWKRQRIVVIQPAARVIAAVAHFSQWDLIFPPNNAVCRLLAQGFEVGDAYSQTIEAVLQHEELRTWEYILTVEHDNAPPRDGVLKLIETLDQKPELAAVSGLYWTKGEDGVAHIWGDPFDPIPNYRPQVPRPNQVQECCGLSMGFTLYRMSLFADKQLPRPLFKTKASAQGVGTQDLAFWTEARKQGYRCAVDNRVRVGHVDLTTGICW